MNIDIDTKMITLLGYPLKQSYAARMQNKGYESANLNFCYFYTEMENDFLQSVINGIKYMNFVGFAVTKPNKVKVLQYLDELDPLCEAMGSCNTVLIAPNHKLIGYNTDGLGFYRSLKEHYVLPLEQTKAFIVGCGGAGRAIATVLAHNGIKEIVLTDIIEDSSIQLANDIKKHYSNVIIKCEKLGSFTELANSQLVINASGIGMGKYEGISPIEQKYLNKFQFCFDACYNPPKTQFLLDAESKGCQILNGLEMSLYQAVEQIKIWTGNDKINVENAMRQELYKILEEQGITYENY